jgi:Tfp pilus assembly protein PilV
MSKQGRNRSRQAGIRQMNKEKIHLVRSVQQQQQQEQQQKQKDTSKRMLTWFDASSHSSIRKSVEFDFNCLYHVSV